MFTPDDEPVPEGAGHDAEREVVFATFQPGRFRKWSRGEMRRLTAHDIQDLLGSRRAVVLAHFESADGARFRP
jgi:hypothetical protein